MYNVLPKKGRIFYILSFVMKWQDSGKVLHLKWMTVFCKI